MPIWLGAVEENTSADRCTECYAARQPKWWPVGALQDSKSRILLAKALSGTKVCGLKKKKKVCGFFRAAWELPCGDVNVAKIVLPKLHAAMMVLICGRSRSRYGQPDNGIAQ